MMSFLLALQEAENGRSPSHSSWGLAATLCCVEDIRQCLCAATSACCPCFHAQKRIPVLGQTQHPSSTQWAQQPALLSWPLFFPPAPLPTQGPPPHGTHPSMLCRSFLGCYPLIKHQPGPWGFALLHALPGCPQLHPENLSHQIIICQSTELCVPAVPECSLDPDVCVWRCFLGTT